jgi:hypothetical protein
VAEDAEKTAIEKFLGDLLIARLEKLGIPKPSTIVSGDRPDLTLHFGNQTIGLEVTRGAYQEYVRGGKLRSHFPHLCVTTTHLVDGTRRRSDLEIEQDLIDPDPAWKDALQELDEWRAKLTATIVSKREKLNKPNFRRFDRNWLLIHDEPAHNHHADHAVEVLSKISLPMRRFNIDFDEIFLLSGKFLFGCHHGIVRYHFDESAQLYELR